MRLTAYTLTAILFLVLAPIAKAGDSSVNVRVNNRVNAGSSGISSFKTSTSTKINISQEGEGTSSVTVNGQEWKLEGPGEINVNENISSTPTQSPSQNPSPTLNPTPTFSPAPSPTLSPTVSPNPTHSVTPFIPEIPNFPTENVGNRIEKFVESIHKIFENIFSASNAVINGAAIFGLK